MSLTQPPPRALLFSHGRGKRETSDWWWTVRDHGKGTDGRRLQAFSSPARRFLVTWLVGYKLSRVALGTKMWSRCLLSPSHLPLRARFHQERDVWVRGKASLMTLDSKHLTGTDRSWIRHHLMYIHTSRVNDLFKTVSLSVSIHFRVLMCSHDGNLRASVYRHLYCFSFLSLLHTMPVLFTRCFQSRIRFTSWSRTERANTETRKFKR